MAEATVFVDDAVLGRLPAVCVKSGAPADVLVHHEISVGGLGAGAWVLVLLGPLGWLALAVIALGGAGRERVRILLPYTEEAYAPVRRFLVWKAVCVVALVAGLALLIASPFLIEVTEATTGGGLVALLVLAVGAVVFHQFGRDAHVDASLDGSRRWIRLRRVSAEFALATRRQSDRAPLAD